MHFFLDQCVPISVYNNFLKKQDHKAELLRNLLPTNAPDEVVLNKAQQQQIDAILVTLNGDFADNVTYPPENYKGIISLQVRNRPEAIPHILEMLNRYLSDNPFQKHYAGKLLLVESHRIRIR